MLIKEPDYVSKDIREENAVSKKDERTDIDEIGQHLKSM